MSIFINEVAVTTFDPLVKQAYQEKGFKLGGTTRMARTPKKTHKFPKLGKSMAKQKAAQDMVVPSNLVWSEAEVILQPWYDAEYSGIFGQADINFDEKRELAEALAKSIGRRSDQLIIDALDNSGTSNIVTAGGTGFTYLKFQEMIRLFTAKSIFTGDDDIHCIINGVAQEDILNDDKFINTRYTADRLFDNGNTLNGLKIGGVTFHVFGDMAEGGIPFSSPTYSAFAWAKQSVGMAISLDFSSMVTYEHLFLSYLVTTSYQANAVAIDAEGVVEIQYI